LGQFATPVPIRNLVIDTRAQSPKDIGRVARDSVAINGNRPEPAPLAFEGRDGVNQRGQRSCARE
jgi:hypothetical protein